MLKLTLRLLSAVVTLLLIALLLTAKPGGLQFPRVSVQALLEELESSRMNSAESWWYLGEKRGCHWFVRVRPTELEGFRVPVTELEF